MSELSGMRKALTESQADAEAYEWYFDQGRFIVIRCKLKLGYLLFDKVKSRYRVRCSRGGVANWAVHWPSPVAAIIAAIRFERDKS